MLVCDSHNFIFIHIQRTGGTSIREMCHNLPINTYEKESFHTHINNLEDFDILNNYKTFAFVRNPWDRVLSWYKLLMNNSIQNKTIDFEDYVLNFEEFNRSKNEQFDFLLNQYDYIYKDGEKVVDYIGRFENYSNDLKDIFSKFDINIESIPKVNGTQHKKYRDYYNDKTASYIEEKSYKDIKHFGYKF